MPNDFANPRNGDGFGANTGRRVSLGGNDGPVDPSTNQQPLPVRLPADYRPDDSLVTRQGEVHDLPEDDEDE